VLRRHADVPAGDPRQSVLYAPRTPRGCRAPSASPRLRVHRRDHREPGADLRFPNSLTRQAIQLGYFPRLRVNHTHAGLFRADLHAVRQRPSSHSARIATVVFFGSTEHLSAAYGVSGHRHDWRITTISVFISRRAPALALAAVARVAVMAVFFPSSSTSRSFGANAHKLGEGGWVSARDRRGRPGRDADLEAGPRGRSYRQVYGHNLTEPEVEGRRWCAGPPRRAV